MTLTGSGGVGKTRLARVTAADLLDAYPARVWLVELDSLTDAWSGGGGVESARGAPLDEAAASALDTDPAGRRLVEILSWFFVVI